MREIEKKQRQDGKRFDTKRKVQKKNGRRDEDRRNEYGDEEKRL